MMDKLIEKYQQKIEELKQRKQRILNHAQATEASFVDIQNMNDCSQKIEIYRDIVSDLKTLS